MYQIDNVENFLQTRLKFCTPGYKDFVHCKKLTTIAFQDLDSVFKVKSFTLPNTKVYSEKAFYKKL
jgi:hypothetical protein